MNIFGRNDKEKDESMDDYIASLKGEIREDQERQDQMMGNIIAAGDKIRQSVALMYSLSVDSLPEPTLEKTPSVSTRVGAITVVCKTISVEVRVNANNSSYEGPYEVGVKVAHPNNLPGTADRVATFEDWDTLPEIAADLLVDWARENKDVVKRMLQASLSE